MIKVHQAVAQALADHGVEILFGVMGHSNLAYIAAHVDVHGGQYIAAKHEAGATGMADGYARLTGKPGVVTVTHGPGVTNTITALTEAARARTPLLLLTSESPYAKREHSQALDIPATIAPTGALYARVKRPQDAVDDIGRALRRMTIERRPLVLDLPADIANLETEYAASPYGAVVPQRVEPDAAAIDAALGYLVSANRPLLLAGRGAVLSGAGDAIKALADRTGALLATTAVARGLFSGHPHNLGIFGTLATSAALTAIQQADCILAFGAGLNENTTDRGNLLRGKIVVQTDVDEGQLARYQLPDRGVVGDALKIAETMLAQLAAADITRTRDHSALIAALTESDLHAELPAPTRPGTVSLRSAMLALSKVLPARRSLVTDGGRFMLSVWRWLEATDPASCLYLNNFGSLGLGLGAAIGAAAARPDELCLAVLGDGGAMASLLELETAVRYGLPLAVVVANDDSYGMEHQELAGAGFDPRHADFSRPDLAAVARALGARALRVTSAQDLAGLNAEVFDRANLPVLIDIKTDVEAEYFAR
jgi:acetolactate synthase I/II/III large subunit